jgi:bifunctional UDP-N-acetylglucosamine pyrophosphorylase/glucosamine-1-phosphate N-acetyltransferase
MLEVSGKNLLAHKIDLLPDTIDEVVLVVGYLGDVIRNAFGDAYGGRKITYVAMGDLHGTAAAVWLCKELVTGPTLVLMGDDLYGKDDMAHAVTHAWYVGLQEAMGPFDGGRMDVVDGKLVAVVEGGGVAGEFVNTGMYVIGPELFQYDMVQLPSGEFGLPQTIAVLAKDITVATGPVSRWVRITASEDLATAEADLVQYGL